MKIVYLFVGLLLFAFFAVLLFRTDMRTFSAKIVYLLAAAGALSAVAAFGVMYYWYGSVMHLHEERVVEQVHSKKQIIQSVYSENYRASGMDAGKAFELTVKMLRTSFLNTTQYGFSSGFSLVVFENGQYHTLFSTINGQAFDLKEPVGNVDKDCPAAMAYEGLSGVVVNEDCFSEKRLVGYDFVDLHHKRLILLSYVPYDQIAKPKVAVTITSAVFSLLMLFGGGLVFMYFSGKNFENLMIANKELEIFGNIFDCANELIAYIDADGRFVVVNSAFEKMFGVSKDDVAGVHLKDFHGDRRYDEYVSESFESSMSGRSVKHQSWLELSSGRRIYLDINYVPHKIGSRVAGVVMTASDITELENAKQQLLERTYELKDMTIQLERNVKMETRKRLQNEQLFFEQKKFADMGQMINAIAHQWRQPLNSLSLYIQFILECIKDGSVTEENIEEFKNDSISLTQHMSKTIDDFRSFFDPRTDESGFEVIKAISETISLVDAQLKSTDIDYEVACRCAGMDYGICGTLQCPECVMKMTSVSGYPSEFKQVMMNLIQNAKDALSEKQKDRKLKIFVDTSAQSVKISVKDNGGGISDENLIKIFDPYFTTKSEGKGTGIGLYMSRLIIEDHMKGTIRAKCADGETTFEIVLPRTDFKESESSPEGK